MIFTRDIWEELKKNSNYSELIEDIEDRMELEQAIDFEKKNGNKFVDFDSYDKKSMSKINNSKKAKTNALYS